MIELSRRRFFALIAGMGTALSPLCASKAKAAVADPVYASGKCQNVLAPIYFIERNPRESRDEFEARRQNLVSFQTRVSAKEPQALAAWKTAIA
jgi:hypothetical protein